MLRRFDVTDKNVKEMQNDLSVIGKKVDAYVVLIKHLKLQMTQMSITMNPRQPSTLLTNTIQNLKNDGHCMTITTTGGKQNNDPSMSSRVDTDRKEDIEVIGVIGESATNGNETINYSKSSSFTQTFPSIQTSVSEEE